MRLVFVLHAWDDYKQGKPEPLRYGISGAWSRRIDEEHRLVYVVRDDDLFVLQARYHYTRWPCQRAAQGTSRRRPVATS